MALSRICSDGACVTLPTYRFQRERHWIDQNDEGIAINSGGRAVGRRIDSSVDPAAVLWPVHLTRDEACRPARLLEVLFDVAAELTSACSLRFIDVEFEHDDRIPETVSDIQAAARVADDGGWTVGVSARSESGWHRLCEGRLTAPLSSTCVSDVASHGSTDHDDTVKETCLGKDAIGEVLRSVQSAAERALGQARIVRIGAMRRTIGVDPAIVQSTTRMTRTGIEAVSRALSDAGECVAELDTVVLEQRSAAQTAGDAAYEFAWRKCDSRSPAGRGAELGRGAVLVIGDGPGVQGFADALRTRGRQAVRVAAGSAFSQVGDGIYGSPLASAQDFDEIVEHWTVRGGLPIAAVVHFSDGDQGAGEIGGGDLLRSQDSGCLRVADAMRWLVDTGRSGRVRLWVVTRGAWPLVAADRTAGVQESPVWGLTRVASRECPELFCASIDLGYEPSGDEVSGLAELVETLDVPSELALRGTERFVAQFDRASSGGADGSLALRDDRTYLITGGLGAIALEIARWMAARGARHFALVGRRDPTPEVSASLESLAARGAQTRVFRGDVSVAADIARVLADIDRDMPPLAGILHTAGVVEGALIPAITKEQFGRVFQPKACGAWNLHDQTKGRPLDFFVMCSSIAASLSHAGLGAYASSNVFLDALAMHRRAAGLPGLSIEWGPWAGTGLLTQTAIHTTVREYLNRGIHVLTSPIALEAFGRLLHGQHAVVLVAPISWSRFTAAEQRGEYRGLVSALFDRHRPAAAAPAAGLARAQLFAANVRERRLRLTDLLRQQLAEVLRTDASRLDANRPFGTVGLDSLLALELVRRVSSLLDLQLTATIVFNHPTLSSLSAEVAKRMKLEDHDQLDDAPMAASEGPVPAFDGQDVTEEDAVLILMNARGGVK
jgi:NAD(P)-dependent dehydrogenase (short-subunit alcohol dehydrogenase family)/acyl carrier protein